MGQIFIGIPMTERHAIMGPPPSPNRGEHPYEGSINFQGILVLVENARGSVREGRDTNGQPWRVKMQHHYGEIAGTLGADGDPVDAYVGPYANAPMAYIMHQRHYFGTEHEVPGVFDEDKVMLGFSTKDEAMQAYAAHFNHPIRAPGCTPMPIEELRARIADGELNLGAALVKGRYPTKSPGAGWERIPKPRGGRHGWRKRKGGGKRGYTYKYDDELKPAKPKLATKDQRKKAMEANLERDPSRATADIKPGEIIEIGGRSGRYKWVPGAKREGSLTTSVQSMSTGAVELVRKNTLIALRKRTRKKPPPPPTRKKKVPPPPPSRPAARADDVIPEDWPSGPNIPPQPPRGQERPSLEARKAAVWEHSTAPEGSALEAMENGSLGLRYFRGRHDKRLRLTIEVPDDIKEKLANEMTGVFHQAARKIAKNMRPPIPVVVAGTNTLTSDYKDLVAGAQLGFVMALTNYRGGRAFIPVAQDYAAVYALQAARQIRRGVTIKERDLRALKGYIAARSRAATKTRAKTGKEPTREEIVKHWYLTKRMTFTGRGERLGSYATKDADGEDKIVDQAHEEVPLEGWQIKTPDGTPAGATYPGKLELAEKMERLLDGENVADDEWLATMASVLPDHSDLATSAGTALHVQREVMQILATMKDPHATALAMRFGMHTPEDEDADALHAKSNAELKAMARDRGLRVGGSKSEVATRILQWSANQNRPGTKGHQASAVAVGDALDLRVTVTKTGKQKKPLDDRSLGAKVRRIWKEALTTFRAKAERRDGAVIEHVRHWGPRMAQEPGPQLSTEFSPFLPAHSELKQRFGTDERVYIYQAAIRAGNGQRVGKLLEREKNNELTPAESNALREDYHRQQRLDAQEQFNRYQTVTIDPARVHDIGPHTGTPGEAEWLYTGDVLARHMQAQIRSGAEAALSSLPLTTPATRSAGPQTPGKMRRF